MFGLMHLAVRFLVAGACTIVLCCDGPSMDSGPRGDTTTLPEPKASVHDWTRFGWNATRSNASTDSTGIDSANVATLRRQQVAIDGTVDASAIYLHGVQVNGAAHDVFFVTTTYGKTLAVDAADGSILWRFTPPDYNSFVGSYRITTSTPVADPDRRFIYAAAPDGSIRKLAVNDGRVVWSTSITTLPTREKIASPLNFDRGHVIATTGGYIGDAPPYQGHVAVIDAAAGTLLHVWNSLCSDRAGLIAPSSCSESGSAIWGRAGAAVDTTTGDIVVTTGDGLWDGRTFLGRRGDRAGCRRHTYRCELHADEHQDTRGERHGPRLDESGVVRRRAACAGREGRDDQGARSLADIGRRRPSGQRGTNGVDAFRRWTVHGAGGGSDRYDDLGVRGRQWWDSRMDPEWWTPAAGLAEWQCWHEPGGRWRPVIRV